MSRQIIIGVLCRDDNEATCALMAYANSVSQHDHFVWVDPSVDPQTIGTYVQTPEGPRGLVNAVNRFSARPPRPDSDKPFAKQRNRLLIQLLLGVLVLCCATAAASKGMAPVLLRQAPLTIARAIWCLPLAILTYLTTRIQREVGLTDIGVYVGAVFRPSTLPRKLGEPLKDKHRLVVMSYLLNEISVRLPPKGKFMICQLRHANGDDEAANTLAKDLLRVAHDAGTDITLVFAYVDPKRFMAMDTNEKAIPSWWPSNPGIMCAELRYGKCPDVDLDGAEEQFKERYPDHVDWIVAAAHVARKTTFVQSQRVALHEIIKFLDDGENISRLSTAFHTNVDGYGDGGLTRRLWIEHRHRAIEDVVKGEGAPQFANFYREFIWLHAMFPRQALHTEKLLKLWPKQTKGITIPSRNGDGFGHRIGQFLDWPILQKVDTSTLQLHKELEPSEIQRIALGALSEFPTYLVHGYWSLLQRFCEQDIESGTSQIGDSLAYVDDVLTKGQVATDEHFRDNGSRPEAIVRCVYDIARQKEREGPLKTAVQWHERAVKLSKYLGTTEVSHPEGNLSSGLLQRRANQLRSWTHDDRSPLPLSSDTIFPQLWKAYLRGEVDKLSGTGSERIPWSQPEVTIELPWLASAQRAFVTALEFERAGGWLVALPTVHLIDFDIDGASKVYLEVLGQPNAPRILQFFCLHQLLALSQIDPACERQSQLDLIGRWSQLITEGATPHSEPHHEGWWYANEARLAFWRGRIDNVPPDLGSPTFSLFDRAEAILVQRLGLQWAAYELDVDRCYASGFSVMPRVSPVPAAVSWATRAMEQARQSNIIAGRMRLYGFLIQHYLAFGVPKALELIEDARQFAEAHGFGKVVTTGLLMLKSPVLFNAQGVQNNYDQFINVEIEVLNWLEDELNSNRHIRIDEKRLRTRTIAAKGYIDIAYVIQRGLLQHKYHWLETPETYLERGRARLDQLDPGGLETRLLRAILLRNEIAFEHNPDVKHDKLLEATALLEALAAEYESAKHAELPEVLFEYAQTLLARIAHYERAALFTPSPNSRAGNWSEARDALVSRLNRCYEYSHWVLNNGAWKYVRARLAEALEQYEPALQFTWPESSLVGAARDTFAMAVTASRRLSLVRDAFRQYCELEEFGPAVAASRQLMVLYEDHPELKPQENELDRAEELCRRLIASSADRDRSNAVYLFHATHVLYALVVGTPYFSNDREQFFQEAMVHLHEGHPEEARSLFAAIIQACKADPRAVVLDCDLHAFQSLIFYLRERGEHEAAEDLAHERDELVARGACQTFLAISKEKREKGEREHARVYL